jgi:hypothetical protein
MTHSSRSNTAGPESWVLDLRVAHDRVDSSVDPALNGHLRYPNNLDQSLNDTSVDKIRRYHDDYSNNPPRGVDFMTTIVSTSGRLHGEFVRILFIQAHRETDRFLHLQEFCQYNQIVDSSTTVARRFLLCSNLGLEIFSPRLQVYVLILIKMGCLSHRSLTLTPRTRKLLVYYFRCSISTTNPVSERCLDSSFLVFSLSSHRYSYISLLFSSRFFYS